MIKRKIYMGVKRNIFQQGKEKMNKSLFLLAFILSFSLLSSGVFACDLYCDSSSCINANTTIGIEICLNASITSGGLIQIGADDQTLNCEGYYVNNTTSGGISTGSSDNVTIKNCNVIGRGISVDGTSSDCYVYNNTVRDFTNGQGISVVGSPSVFSPRNTFDSNEVYNCRDGFYNSQAHNTTLINNYFHDLDYYGIASYGTPNNDRINITNNTIRNTTRHGIHVSNSPYAVIDDNKVYDTAKTVSWDAIHVNGSTGHNATISNNIINNSYNGIDINGTTHDSIIYGNQINHTLYYGIEVDSDRANVSFNDVWNPADFTIDGVSGIYLASSVNSSVHNNNVIGYGSGSGYSNSYGIKDNFAEGTSIFLNYIEDGNRGLGGCVYGGDTHQCNVYNNTIYNMSDFCLNTEATNNTIYEYNNMTMCGDEGIFGGFAGASTPNLVIRYNHVENADEGLQFFQVNDSQVYSNNFTNCTYGIRLFTGQDSYGNYFYDNYIANVTNEAYDDGDLNYWNVTKQGRTNILGGYWTGGNYWEGYTGNDTDSDGIGNTEVPYNASDGITGSGGDYLPLVLNQPAPPNASTCDGNVNTSITLTSNVTGNLSNSRCFEIKADDVVLDCAGFSIISNESNAIGIGSYNYDNVTIKNCNIYGYLDAIQVTNSDDSTIEYNNIYDTERYGITLGVSSTSNFILHNYIYNTTQQGIRLEQNTDFTIIDNNTIDLGDYGIITQAYNNGWNDILNNVISNMATAGIFIAEGDNNNEIVNNYVHSSDTGIKCNGNGNQAYCEVFDNTLENISQGAIVISGSAHSFIENNTVEDSTRAIYLLTDSDNATIQYNNVTGQGGWGILAETDSSHNTYQHNLVDGYDNCYNSDRTSDNVFYNNTANDCGTAFRIVDSNDTVFDNNLATDCSYTRCAWIWKDYRIQFINNNITGFYERGIQVGNSGDWNQDHIIAHNYVDGLGNMAVAGQGISASFNNSNITVWNNTIERVTDGAGNGAGAEIHYTNNSKVYGNRICNSYRSSANANSGFGLSSFSYNNEIYDNEIHCPNINVLLFGGEVFSGATSGTGNSVHDNIISGGVNAVSGTGIASTDYHAPIDVYNNIIYNNTYGLRIGYVGLGFPLSEFTNSTNNTIYDNDYGLYVNSNSDDNNFTDEWIYNNSVAEIHVLSGTNNTFENVRIGYGGITSIDSFQSAEVSMKQVETSQRPPQYQQNASVRIETLGNFLNMTNLSSSGWIYLNMTYDTTGFTGSENTIRLYRYTGSQWVQVPNSSVNTVLDYAYGNVTQFSIFAPMGSTTVIEVDTSTILLLAVCLLLWVVGGIFMLFKKELTDKERIIGIIIIGIGSAVIIGLISLL